jgi:hypothetical protein
MTSIKFTGTDYRFLIGAMCDAWENRLENGNLPDIEVNGEVHSFGSVAAIIQKEIDYDETPLLDEHEQRVNAIFKRRQRGYGRTAHNLYKRDHDSMQNAIWARAQKRIVRDENAALLAGYTAQEIDDLKTAMRERWKELGKKMRELKGKDEDGACKLRDDRARINRALWWIERGKLPTHLSEYSGAEDILAPFHARYEMWKTDDAAMNAEFQRRAEIRRLRGKAA